jgi:glutathione S-transferase
MVELVSTLVGSAAPSGLMSALTARSDRAFDMLESRLGQVAFLAGTQFTAADIMMVFPLTTMREFAPRDLSPYPNILTYLQRIAARQAFQRAMAKADPGYNLLLN